MREEPVLSSSRSDGELSAVTSAQFTRLPTIVGAVS